MTKSTCTFRLASFEYVNPYTVGCISSKVCHEEGEHYRDHVDLLLSSKHWPVVFAVDMACDVTAHVEVRHPKLANALWGAEKSMLSITTSSE